MKELDFLEKINDLDPALLEETPVSSGRARPKLIRRVAIAAAAVLLLAGTVYAVARGIELRRISRFGGEEQGVEAKTELPLVPWADFTGEIQNAGARIAEQFKTYKPEPVFSSYLSSPADDTRRLRTIEDAMDYIGLPGLKTPSFPFGSYDCSVTAHGDEQGRVNRVTLYAEHIEQSDIGAQGTVTILTEHAQEAEYRSGGVWTPEFPRDVEFVTYTTPGGNECRIAELRPEYDSGFMSLTGYLSAGPAFYELNLGAVPLEKYELALEMLRQWADALD